MFDKFRLKDALAEYKKRFVDKQWPDEKYKWEAVKCFQLNWDINSSDFPQMLKMSLSQTGNLLGSLNNFPAKMITNFAQAVPEEVRAMFIDLFDESKDLYGRISDFKNKSNLLLERYGNGAAQHYQYENAITTYLWLKYPDKYYIYKFSEVKAVADELECDYSFKKGKYADNIRNFMALYDEICTELHQDEELKNMLKAQITPTCYDDPELKTLTVDVGFYISRYYNKGSDTTEKDGWWPSDYTPALSVDDWVGLLGDSEIFTESSLEIMKRMLDYGGKATCTQLSTKYGETKNFYNSGSVALAKRIVKKTGCPVMVRDEENARLWPVLYVGKIADNDEEGSYVWKLRDELSDALNRVDLSEVRLYAQDSEKETRNFWFLNANPKIWSMAAMAVKEVKEYTLFNENGNKRRIFRNFLAARAGDMVIGYESTPVKQIVALLRVSAEQDDQKIYFEKIEGLSSPIDFAALKSCPELENMEYFSMPQGSLFKLTPGEYDFIMDMIREDNPVVNEDNIEKYDKSGFLDEVYMTESGYDMLVSVLKNRKNLILQGAPGVGKTFAAKRLAYSIMGEKDDSRIEFVQFHQNYSYEDFIMGYKPSENGFELRTGIFYKFCQKAANQPKKDYFFIIDEINRGNMSKIFGELLMLIENNYRGTKITMAYNGVTFSVPANLYIIGMMNTADRSLAMIDYALRRRFSFYEMVPGFDSDGFVRYQNKLDNETFNQLIDKIKELNIEIANDRSLGKGFCIGHSYFSNWGECTDEKMQSVVDFDILPMLNEYWFDDPAKLQRWSNILHGVLQ
ncbi:MAG: EVE domain-containing protein [Lachnospiraceae bacterium]|nr:EVE domain-containing protein [Lachnospiraceae bacterium]